VPIHPNTVPKRFSLHNQDWLGNWHRNIQTGALTLSAFQVVTYESTNLSEGLLSFRKDGGKKRPGVKHLLANHKVHIDSCSLRFCGQPYGIFEEDFSSAHHDQ
jgi:hypothetical protein